MQVGCVRAANLSTKSTIFLSWVRQYVVSKIFEDTLDVWNFNQNCNIGLIFSEFVHAYVIMNTAA